MNQSDFITYLTSASYNAVKFAERYVKNEMKYDFKFKVELNQSYDHNATEENDLYPEDDGKTVTCQSFHEVADLLSRESKNPEWIDISAIAVDRHVTLLELRCCGRFTAIKENMYYSERGQGPFGIKSPPFPAGFDSDSGKKFKLKKVDRDRTPHH
jgi:hypothetical protein